MRVLAFLLATAATAAGPAAAGRPLAIAQASTQPGPKAGADQKDDDEEDEDDKAAKKPSGPGDTAPTSAPRGPGPAAAPSGTSAAQPAPPSPSASGRAQTLVSGAPLYNPNVAVHIVERKPFSDKGKHEIAIFPAVGQLNGKFTQHFGTALNYAYHVHENFALQILPQWNWYNAESSFNEELIARGRVEAQAATSLLLNWGVVGGVEVVPLYGKFAWYEANLLQYSVIISGAAGYGDTRHQLKPPTETTNPEGIVVSSPATFGDTGSRFLGSIGGGFRVQFGDRFAVRLEVRDLVYTARVDRVNGCDVGDLEKMDQDLRRGLDPAQSAVNTGCRRERFAAASGANTNVPLAYSLVREPTSDVLNLVSFYAGASFLF
jgi:outer membrane beta-barrel protein